MQRDTNPILIWLKTKHKYKNNYTLPPGHVIFSVYLKQEGGFCAQLGTLGESVNHTSEIPYCIWSCCAPRRQKSLPVQGYLGVGWPGPTRPRPDQRQASSILSPPGAWGRSGTSRWSARPGPCRRTSRRPTSLCGHGLLVGLKWKINFKILVIKAYAAFQKRYKLKQFQLIVVNGLGDQTSNWCPRHLW